MRLVVLLLSILVSLSLLSQKGLVELSTSSWLETAQVSFCAMDLSSGEILLDEHAQRNAVPASVTKLVSGLWAYETLGPNYKFETTLSYSGHIDDQGVLHGDLIWLGSGDPSLASEYAQRAHQLPSIWAKALKLLGEAGIQRIEGDVVVYLGSSDYKAIGDYWPYQDIGNYYGAGAYGLNVLDNSYRLVLQQNTSIGQVVEIKGTVPTLPLRWINRLVSGPAGSGDQAYIYGTDFSEDRALVGTIPIGTGSFEIKGALPNPPEYFVRASALALEQAGISSCGWGVQVTPLSHDTLQPLMVLQSANLASLLKHSLHESDNLYAQALSNMAGRSSNKTLDEYVSEVLEQKGAHRFYDGNGLSANNAISAKSLCRLLQYAHQRMPNYLGILPTTQDASSLRSYCKSIPAEAIRAKTGAISGVRAVSGVLKSKSDMDIAFAFLVNHYDGSSSEVYRRVNALLKELYLSR